LTWPSAQLTLPSTVSRIQLFPQLYRAGTILASIGSLAIAVYYDLAWSGLKHRLNVPHPANLEPRPWNAFQYFSCGAGASVLCFLLAGAAHAPPTLLDHLVGLFMGLCGVIFSAIFAVGLIALYNLWREAIRHLVGQFRFRRYVRSHGGKPESLLPAVPLAILFLALGVSVFVAMGMILDKIPKVLTPLLPHAAWVVIGTMFYALWKGRSHAASLLRLILLAFFTLIMLAFLVWVLAWTASQTAPLLVTTLIAITAINAGFYARWIRNAVLADNFM